MDVQLFSPASNPFIRATSSIFVATGKFCDVEFSASGCGGLCSIVIDFVELVMVQRRANFDNMDVMPLSNGSFEDIEETSTNVTFTGSFGAWSKTAGSGVVGIAFVGSANCYNLPSTGGLYALWMETVTNSDTTVSQSVSLAPGAAYMVRWHYAMRQVNGTSTANPVSSALNVSLCGTVVAGGFTAPSLLFEEASSTIFTPVGTTNITCELAFIILRGASTLRSLLIDEVELVRVRNPNLVPSGSFEGLTTTTTSWVVYPGIFGDWNSSGHSSGRIAVARIPSTECDNIVSLASPYVLWMQSSTSAPETSVSVAINSLVSGSTYRVRWVFARRKHASTTFASPTLSVFVFGNTIASGRSPVSDVFVADESSDFVASNSTTTLTLAVSINVGVLHMLIDDVEVVLVKAVAIAGSPPFVREFTIPSISSITYVRNYSLPTSWLATLSAETVANMAVLSAASGFLYIGMSLSVAGSSCHVLVYSIADGTFFGSHSVSCTGGSVRCMIVRSGQLFVGHIGAVSHVTLAGDSLVRVLDWGVVSTTIVDMATSNQYFIASGNDTSALKWNVPELFPTTTTTTTSTRTTTTTTRTTTSTTTTTRTTSTTTTTSTTSKTTTTSIAGNNTDGSPNPALGFGLSRIITLSAVSVASVFLVIAIVFAVVSHCRNKGHKYNQLHSKITGHPFINENNPLFVGEIPMYNPNARIVYSRSVGGFGLNGYPPIASPGRGRRPSREADDVRQFTQGNFTDQHRTHDPSVRSPPNLYYND